MRSAMTYRPVNGLFTHSLIHSVFSLSRSCRWSATRKKRKPRIFSDKCRANESSEIQPRSGVGHLCIDTIVGISGEPLEAPVLLRSGTYHNIVRAGSGLKDGGGSGIGEHYTLS